MAQENNSDKKEAKISLIAALGVHTRALGKGGHLLWNIKADMARFKSLTMGHPVVMGRKTWESIPQVFRPLPGRSNIVVTRQNDYLAEGALCVSSLSHAIVEAAKAPGADEIFVIGGGELYAEALSLSSRLYLTLVEDNAEGDVFFPEYPEFTEVREEEFHKENIPHFSFVTLERP